MTTVRELVESTAAVIGDRTHARWLVEVAVSADRVDDVLDEEVTERMVAHLDAMVGRYRSGEPLQYVLGRWAFRHLDLFVDERYLFLARKPKRLWALPLSSQGRLKGDEP